jgi:hypothetical protein
VLEILILTEPLLLYLKASPSSLIGEDKVLGTKKISCLLKREFVNNATCDANIEISVMEIEHQN